MVSQGRDNRFEGMIRDSDPLGHAMEQRELTLSAGLARESASHEGFPQPPVRPLAIRPNCGSVGLP